MTHAPRARTPMLEAPARTGTTKANVSIGDVAREFSITTRTIRFYESRGLLRLTRRGSARTFSPADRRRLALILRAKNLGLTLEEIGEHLSLYHEHTTDRAALEDLKSRADAQIALLTGKRADVTSTLGELRTIRREIAAELARLRTPR